MPLDRLSALRRALVPRIGLGLTFTSRTVEYVQHPASPNPGNVSRRQNPFMPAVSALKVTHPSQTLPSLGNRLNDRIHAHVSPCQLSALPGCHVLPQIRRKPQKVSRLSGRPGGLSHRCIRTITRGIEICADRHDHSTSENDSHFPPLDHPGRASPHSLPSPHPESTEMREALLGHLEVRARGNPPRPNKRSNRCDT